MKMYTEKLKNGLYIEKRHTDSKTQIIIYDSLKRKELDSLNTCSNFLLDYLYNDLYVISYSHGSIPNTFPIDIREVLDIDTLQILKLSPTEKEKIYKMFIPIKRVKFFVLIDILNDCSIGCANEEDIKEFIDYVTDSNSSILIEDVKQYILLTFENLHRYVNLKSNEKELKKVLRSPTTYYYFHAMPQKLKT